MGRRGAPRFDARTRRFDAARGADGGDDGQCVHRFPRHSSWSVVVVQSIPGRSGPWRTPPARCAAITTTTRPCHGHWRRPCAMQSSPSG